jgi:hypothetical protein
MLYLVYIESTFGVLSSLLQRFIIGQGSGLLALPNRIAIDVYNGITLFRGSAIGEGEDAGEGAGMPTGSVTLYLVILSCAFSIATFICSFVHLHFWSLAFAPKVEKHDAKPPVFTGVTPALGIKSGEGEPESGPRRGPRIHWWKSHGKCAYV